MKQEWLDWCGRVKTRLEDGVWRGTNNAKDLIQEHINVETSIYICTFAYIHAYTHINENKLILLSYKRKKHKMIEIWIYMEEGGGYWEIWRMVRISEHFQLYPVSCHQKNLCKECNKTGPVC